MRKPASAARIRHQVRNGDCVRASDLAHAENLARILADTIQLDLPSALAEELSFANHLAYDIADCLARARVSALVRDLNRALAGIDALTEGLAGAIATSRTHARNYALDHVVSAGDNLTRDCGLNRHQVTVRDLSVFYQDSLTLKTALYYAATAASVGQEHVLVRTLAERTAMATATLLPAAHRSRYREEFASDLAVLAESRIAQWQYVVGVLTTIWHLRRSLAKDVPPWERRR